MFAEIIFGLKFHSMALFADGLHMGTHVTAFLITVLAYFFARRHAAVARFSFGTGKFGVLGAFTSAIVLGGVALVMAGESISRLIHPLPIQFNQAIVVACLGLAVNVTSAWILKDKHNHTGTHMLTFSMNEPSLGVVQLALSKTTAARFSPLSNFNRRFLRFTRSKSLASRPNDCSIEAQISLNCSEVGQTCKSNGSRNCSTSTDLPKPSAPNSRTCRRCWYNCRSRAISFSRPTNGSNKFIFNQRSARGPLRVFGVAPSPWPLVTMEFAERRSGSAALLNSNRYFHLSLNSLPP
jgi:hypothetical protein